MTNEPSTTSTTGSSCYPLQAYEPGDQERSGCEGLVEVVAGHPHRLVGDGTAASSDA